jgi:RND family efflux transporter MFP subunit
VSLREKQVTRMIKLAAPAAFLSFLVAGCGDGAGTGRAQRLTEPYPYEVERRNIVGYAELPAAEAFLPEDAEAVVFPPYQAPVEQVMVSEGQTVNKGELLVKLSFPNIEAAKQQSDMAVRDAETALANARSSLRTNLTQYEQSLEQARQAERQLRQQTDAGGDATALVQARQQRELAQDALNAARSQQEAQLEPYKRQLEEARQVQRQAREGLREANISAPISGVVTDINVRPGQEIGQDRRQPVLRIVNVNAVRVRGQMPLDHAAAVKEGSEAAIRFREVPETSFSGKVADIQPTTANGEATRNVVLNFVNEGNKVQPGFTVDWAGIKVGEVTNVLAVPNDAIKVDDTGRPIVQVLENGEWRPRVVEIGMSDGQFTEVRSGLQEGETVQVRPSRR